jgi:hypothetical protein
VKVRPAESIQVKPSAFLNTRTSARFAVLEALQDDAFAAHANLTNAACGGPTGMGHSRSFAHLAETEAIGSHWFARLGATHC